MISLLTNLFHLSACLYLYEAKIRTANSSSRNKTYNNNFIETISNTYIFHSFVCDNLSNHYPISFIDFRFVSQYCEYDSGNNEGSFSIFIE